MNKNICEICGFNPEAPIGVALKDIKAYEYGNLKLNANGMLWLIHRHNHKDFVDIGEYNDLYRHR